MCAYATQVHPQTMVAFGPPRGAPAGWYPDPYGGVFARYFDGYRWTPYVADQGQLQHRRPAAEEPHPVLPLPVTIGAVAILAVSLITTNQLIDSLADRDWNVVVYMALVVVIGYGPSLAWLAYASHRWGTGHVFSDLGVRFRWVDLGWGPLIWISTFVAMVTTVALMKVLDVPYRGNLDTDGGGPFDRDNTTIVSFLIAAVICAPVVEEAVFRGAMMRGLLSKMSAVPAISIQAVLFGAAHFNPDYGREAIGLVIALSVAGAGLGLACYLLRRLGPVMIAHAVMNGVAITVALTR
jgi:membrane protease YdiL (CAAX protease family)